jgi:hypothetical protein
VSRRLPLLGFVLLALATIAAFFLVQTLKTAPPLLWAPLNPIPSALDPVNGRVCISRSHMPLNYAQTKLTLALSRADDSVGVYIVSAANAGGGTIDTISSGTPMVAAPGPAHPVQTQRDSRVFTWNGRLSDGQIAPDGTYYFRVVLAQQDRSINLSQAPVQVLTTPPHPRVLDVRLVGATSTTTGAATTSTTGGSAAAKRAAAVALAPGPAVLTPPQGRVKITFTKAAYRRVWIDVYRTDVVGRPQLVARLAVADLHRNWTFWNGEIDGQPAPAGTYLVGITAQNPACDQASWPATLPPAAGTTPHAGLTIRYLGVTPPLTATASGARARVTIDSPLAPFTWRLRAPANRRVLAHGAGHAGQSQIHVRMPRRQSGLYTLTVQSGRQRAIVPLVASRAGAQGARAPVLVVLPALTWMGDTPVDDTGDGLPATLAAGDGVLLRRPLVNGLPSGSSADAALLAYLRSLHLRYQLTTDVGLAQGRGPTLSGRRGVLFADGEEFLPQALGATLERFVRAGGSVVTLGTETFRGLSHISGFPASPRASAPTEPAADPFGATRGPVTPTSGQLITTLQDPLGILGGPLAFSGFSEYQPIQPPSGSAYSAAGISSGTLAVVGFHYGTGTVIEVGLPDFGASLAHNTDSQLLMADAWTVLSGLG